MEGESGKGEGSLEKSDESKVEIANKTGKYSNNAEGGAKVSSEQLNKSSDTVEDGEIKDNAATAKGPDGKPEASEEEDIPQDFFDDFSNPDFMEGLNIVDAWDDEGNKVVDKNEGENAKRKKKREVEKPGRKRCSKSKEKDADGKREGKKRSSSHKKKSRSKSTGRHRRDKGKEESELRRDPEKTKRDMEKYRVKCVKDQEQKSLTEKLRVVETGLVPPGMEMDVDTDEVLRKAKAENLSEKKHGPDMELNDTWEPHPTLKVQKTVYPDLKPSAVFTDRGKDGKHRRRSRSRSFSGDRRLVRDRRQYSPGYRRRRSSSRGRRRSPSFGRQRRSPSFGRRRRGSPLELNQRKLPRDPLPHNMPFEKRHREPGEHKTLAERSIDYLCTSISPEDKSDLLNLPDIKKKSRSKENQVSKSKTSPQRRRRSRSLSEREAWLRSASRDLRVVKRRSRSGSRTLSEREAWLKDPKREWRKKSRSRSRSRGSPKRKRYEDKKDKKGKISFLEEIHKLLSGGTSQPHANIPPQPHMNAQPPMNMHPQPNMVGHMVPTPAPVPAPMMPTGPPNPQCFPQQPIHNPQFEVYDQQFFIGEGPPIPNNFPGNGIPPQPPAGMGPHAMPGMGGLVVGTPLPPAMAMHMQQPVNDTVPMQLPVHQNKIEPVPPPNFLNHKKHFDGVKAASKEEVTELFESKKISLSDFLAASSNIEDMSAATRSLPKKIQVLSRCQDVLKILDKGRTVTGRLVVSTKPRAKSPQLNFKSPLAKKPLINYAFTTPSDEDMTFSKRLNEILHQAGIIEEVIELDEEPTEDVKGSEPPMPPSPPRITRPPVQLNKNQLMKMVQTDPVKCKDCEKRRETVFIHTSTQCNITVRSIGVQAGDDPLKDALGGNKSLAALTPAQLLMKEKEKARYLDGPETRGPPAYDRFNKFPPRDSWESPAEVNPIRGRFSPTRGRYSPPIGSKHSPPQRERGPYVPSTVPTYDLPPRGAFPLGDQRLSGGPHGREQFFPDRYYRR